MQYVVQQQCIDLGWDDTDYGGMRDNAITRCDALVAQGFYGMTYRVVERVDTPIYTPKPLHASELNYNDTQPIDEVQ